MPGNTGSCQISQAIMNINRDFEQAREKEAQERSYLTTQLSNEGRAELAALEQKRKENMDWMKKKQESDFDKDIDREFNRLLEKEGLELHYRPVWGQGNIMSEEQLKKLAEHNVITQNCETLQKLEQVHNKKHEALLNREGLYLNKGNSQLQLPLHFNERSGKNNQTHDYDKGRDR